MISGGTWDARRSTLIEQLPSRKGVSGLRDDSLHASILCVTSLFRSLPLLAWVIFWIPLLRAEDSADKFSKRDTKKKGDNPADQLAWIEGPATAKLDTRATFRLPADYKFLEKKDANKFLRLTGNNPRGGETGILFHKKEEWWVIFEFDEIGYVKDDDKKDLDADKLLASYREGTESMNERREADGVPPIRILGWHVRPSYNDETKNLEWSVEAESQGKKFVNYNVRLLGRKGVTKITLIEDRENIDDTLPRFRSVLKSHQYLDGETYAEYRQGDMIAKYGLGALVLGGTAAAAAKFGLLAPVILFFKKAWKGIAIALVAAGSWLKSFFGGPQKHKKLE